MDDSKDKANYLPKNYNHYTYKYIQLNNHDNQVEQKILEPKI